MKFPWSKKIALVPRSVFNGDEIISVMMDYDGDWVCYTAKEVLIDEVAVVHRKHLVELDESLRLLPEIPPGHIARRDRRGGDWHIDPPEMTREEWEASG
ncbi:MULTISPECIES: hypothetical protein [unclassified Streptomyces]|uniref:hypothetical protein n=1 Tax=unclassified Streptomyces TaxID=2593676 RepID=UPI002E282083|nr:hypothetical protein [Streptomyces sp. NBC_00223]